MKISRTRATARLRARNELARVTGAAMPGQRLPTVRTLARLAGVSAQVMWSTVHEWCRLGTLSARPRVGITVRKNAGIEGHTAPATPRPRASPQRFVPLADRLRQDLLNGVYPPGTVLPSSKELAGRYGVCTKTLAKALAAARTSGLVARDRRRVAVPEVCGRGRDATLCLVAQGESDGLVTPVTPRTYEHLRMLESECARARISLRIETAINGQATGGARSVLAPSRLSGLVLGYIYWPIGLSDPVAVRSELVSRNKPLAILEETGEQPRRIALGRRVARFSIAGGTGSGLDAGRYLLSMGHRSVAYISPVHAGAWSQQRAQGLADAFAGVGLEQAVRVFTMDHNFPCEFLSQAHSTFTVVNSLLAGGLPSMNSGDRRLVKRAIGNLTATLGTALERESMYERVRGLFDRALRERDITAWVCANDTIALEAMRYLQHSGVRVPGNISVMGFDDSIEGFFQKLTSYNFNGISAIRAMVAHVAGASVTHASTGAAVEISGSVVARASVGRIKASPVVTSHPPEQGFHHTRIGSVSS